MALTLVILFIAVVLLFWKYRVVTKAFAALKNEAAELLSRFNALRAAKDERDAENARQIVALTEKLAATEADRDSLSRFADIRDTAAEAERIRMEATGILAAAQSNAAVSLAAAQQEVTRLLAEVNSDVRQKRGEAEQIVLRASLQAAKVIDDAHKRAEEVGGDALRALADADRITATAAAMKNVVQGYGDAYMIPNHSLLDELAGAYSHTEAGKQLKVARDYSKLMATQKRAAECDYVEKVRRDAAVNFVVDAFNGKVDSVLSRAKVDNFGTLQQEIKDAAALVNYGGIPFRNARILKEYVDARIDELIWAVRTHELRELGKMYPVRASADAN